MCQEKMLRIVIWHIFCQMEKVSEIKPPLMVEGLIILPDLPIERELILKSKPLIFSKSIWRNIFPCIFQQIPTFLPVMRASLSVSKVGSSVAKDPDILEKLDPRGMLAITQRYQSHFKHCAGQRDKMRGVQFL